MGVRGYQNDGGDEILSQINVVPLVDISLVLLIIFMVTANYIMTSSFSVDIPQAKYAKAGQQDDAVSISITSSGSAYLGSEPVTLGELRKRMQSKRAVNPDMAVIISIDKNANFSNVAQILDLLSELGITRLNIAAAVE